MKVKELRAVLAEVAAQKRACGDADSADAAEKFAAFLKKYDAKTISATAKLIRGALR